MAQQHKKKHNDKINTDFGEKIRSHIIKKIHIDVKLSPTLCALTMRSPHTTNLPLSTGVQ